MPVINSDSDSTSTIILIRQREGAHLEVYQFYMGQGSKSGIQVFKDKSCTATKWIKQELKFYQEEVQGCSASDIRNRIFQKKLTWFRLKMESKRVNWEKGHEKLLIDPENIIESSEAGLEKVDLYKELKIQFTGEEALDAGGLLREWIHLGIKKMFSPDLGVF